MADRSEPNTGGVAVWRWYSAYADAQEDTEYTDIKPVDLAGGEEPGRWFPEDHAAALVDVAEAARSWREEGFTIGLVRALDRLDAAKAVHDG